MLTSDHTHKSLAGYQIDAENAAEMARLVRLARVLSEHLGILPAHLDMTRRSAVLDIGCGPGEWVLETAGRYPASHVIGIDISERMTEYARYYAQEHKISNARFQLMDACQPLAFPDASFDLVHARFITGLLSVTAWPSLLGECFRLLRPGGIVCSTEFEGIGITTSLAVTRYNYLIVQACRKIGQCFTPEGEQFGTTAVQHRLLQNAGLQNIQQEAYVINYSANMPAYSAMYENFTTLMKLFQPFLTRTGTATPQEVDELYAQVLEEMAADDFCAVSYVQRVWGEKPDR